MGKMVKSGKSVKTGESKRETALYIRVSDASRRALRVKGATRDLPSAEIVRRLVEAYVADDARALAIVHPLAAQKMSKASKRKTSKPSARSLLRVSKSKTSKGKGKPSAGKSSKGNGKHRPLSVLTLEPADTAALSA